MIINIYDQFAKLQAGVNGFDFTAEDLALVLLKDTATPDLAADVGYASIGSDEVDAGDGYTVGGIQLTGVSWVFDSPSQRYTLDANDVTWTGLTKTFQYAALFFQNTTNKDLILLIDFESAQSITASDYTIEWNASGILSLGANV